MLPPPRANNEWLYDFSETDRPTGIPVILYILYFVFPRLCTKEDRWLTSSSRDRVILPRGLNTLYAKLNLFRSHEYLSSLTGN